MSQQVVDLRSYEDRGIEIVGPVIGLEDANILGPCTLGVEGARDTGPLILGKGVTIRAYAVIYQGSELGDGVQVSHGAVIREDNFIDSETWINSGAQLWPGNRLGKR